MRPTPDSTTASYDLGEWRISEHRFVSPPHRSFTLRHGPTDNEISLSRESAEKLVATLTALLESPP